MITSNNSDGSHGASENCFDSCNLDSGWSDKTGLKSKNFSQIELEAFRKPFKLGWKREIVLRSTHTNSGKKIVDIYYFSPEKNVKLRSYVEIGLYLNRHPECDLEPENFTFARQPIFRAPFEIIRQANPRTTRNENSEVTSPNHQRSRTRSERSDKQEKNEKSEKIEKIEKVEKGSEKNDKGDKEADDVNEVIVDSFNESIPDELFQSIPTMISLDVGDYLGQVSHEEIANEIPRKRLKVIESGSTNRSDQTNNVVSTNHKESPIKTTGLNGGLSNNSFNHSSCEVQSKDDDLPEPPSHSKRKTKSKNEKPSKSETTPKPLKLNSKDPDKLKIVNGVGSDDHNNLNNNDNNNNFETPRSRIEPEVKSSKKKKSKSSAKLDKSMKPEKKNILTKSLPKKTDNDKEFMENNENYADDILHCSFAVTPMASPENTTKNISSVKYNRNEFSEYKTPSHTSKSKSKVSNKHEKNGKKEKKESEKDIVDCIIDSIPEEILNNLPPMLHPAPCSIVCFGKKGIVPTLLCDRCLCLYHPECVPAGIFLDNSHSFICPNCIQPNDVGECVGLMNGRLMGEPEAFAIGMNFRNKGDNLSSSATSMLKHGFRSRNYGSLPLAANFFLDQSQYLTYPDHSSYSKHNKKLLSRSDAVLTNMSSNIDSCSSNLHSDTNRVSGYHDPAILFKRRRKESTENRLPAIPFAPIAPIKYTASEIAEILNVRINKCRKNLNKIKPEFNLLSSGYECLNQIFQHLSTRDLIKVKLTSRTFNRLASQPVLWQEITLKDMVLKDWQYFGRNIVEPMATQSVNFDGIKCPPGSDLNEMWSNFATITDYLKSVKHIHFGMVPTSVIEEIINAAVTENCYNSFSNLETLSVRNLFEDDFAFSSCNLSILENIAYLSSLQHLRVDCKYGLIVNPEDSDLLDRIFAPMTNLKSLSMTSLKGFTVEQFSFLSHLKNLSSLEIGSCLSWANNHDVKSSSSLSPSLSPSPSPPSSAPPSPLSLSHQKHDHQYGHMEPEEEELEDEDEAIVPDATADCIITETHQDIPTDAEIEIEGEVEGEMELEGETDSINNHQENETKDTNEAIIKLKGVFKYLSKLTQLKHLKLVNLTLHDTFNSMPLSLRGMTNLKSLQLENLKIETDASQTLNLLATTITSHLANLKDLTISTNDPYTNKCVLSALKKLDKLQNVTWKVQVNVEDNGQCWVPILKDRNAESELEEDENNFDLLVKPKVDGENKEDQLEMMDLDRLSQTIEKHILGATINIIPQ